MCDKNMIKGTIFALVLLTLFVIPAMASEVYLEPHDSSVDGYCKSTTVDIWADLTDPCVAGAIDLRYDSTCANVTGFEKNTVDWGMFFTWDSSVLGKEWITFCGSQKTGKVLIGTLTIHCENEEGCTTPLSFIVSETNSVLSDTSFYPLENVTWHDGTFTCETPAPNVAVTVNNASFGTMLAGNRQELNVSLTLNNTGTVDANITAVFKTNVTGTYGLNGTGENIIPGNYFELGPDENEIALTNTTAKTVISTLPAGETVTYDAILKVPAGQAADDYSGIVELIIEESS